jgi:hypothetical protein
MPTRRELLALSSGAAVTHSAARRRPCLRRPDPAGQRGAAHLQRPAVGGGPVGAQIVSDPVSFPLASGANVTITRTWLLPAGGQRPDPARRALRCGGRLRCGGPDPAAPRQLNPAYGTGDHLHMNLAGYRALAQAVPLKLLH